MRYVNSIMAMLLISLSIVGYVYAKEEKELYPSGAVHFIYNKNANGELDGLSKEFYENGNIKTEFVYDIGKLMNEKRYRGDGQIEYEFELKNDKKHEIIRAFDPSGSLFRERLLVNAIQEGIERDFYPDGKIKAERTYKDGKKQGSAKGYYKNGRIQGDWMFENGVPLAATIYYMTGEKHLVHEFKDGKIHGVTSEYDKDGKLKAKRYYENDKLIKRELQ